MALMSNPNPSNTGRTISTLGEIAFFFYIKTLATQLSEDMVKHVMQSVM